ncbi:hypothetical protein Nepgr_005038 [Nepenthes gracilis]|uniref:Uncharacterized protein n=1 Tax=Nepenthes gracilis TaxID=150966 RepID=A0AAD3S2G0_NEPGR|nr:hypothetical protein Nepgr_005038 [Nepenthes gracilis]
MKRADDKSAVIIALISTALMFVLSACTQASSSRLHPLVLVPGNGGNQLEARLTGDYKPSSIVCKRWRHPDHDGSLKSDGWYRIWFDPTVLVGPLTRCFAERMMLYYDPVADDYHNAAGVETRVPHFGSTQSLLYLDPHLKHITTYMAPLVESLEKIGYVEGETLFGAPYDFRYGLAGEGHRCDVGSKYLQDLKNLIERASNSNGGKPVIILSHSLGGLFVHQLLIRNPSSWRQKFIKHFVALSTPWRGTVQEMLTFASGYALGVPLVDPLLVRQEQRSSESNLWLMPSPKSFGRSKPLVITPNVTYTAHDIAEFLNDIGFSDGIRPYETRILPLTERLIAPNVPVTCVVGAGVRTPESLFYDVKGFDEQPSIVYGDGDGTVNMVSLLAVESEWAGDENQTVGVIKLNGVSHTAVLSDPNALDQILRVVCSVNSHDLISKCNEKASIRINKLAQIS